MSTSLVTWVTEYFWNTKHSVKIREGLFSIRVCMHMYAHMCAGAGVGVCVCVCRLRAEEKTLAVVPQALLLALLFETGFLTGLELMAESAGPQFFCLHLLSAGTNCAPQYLGQGFPCLHSAWIINVHYNI